MVVIAAVKAAQRNQLVRASISRKHDFAA